MCLSVFKKTFSNLNMGWDDIERRYATTLLNLGPYGSSLYLWLEINHRISQFREIGGFSDDSYPPEASSSQSLLAELVHIQDILAAFDHLSGSLPVCLKWCSPKIKTLVDILLSRASQTSQCIIFVEQRQVAVCLARMLPCIPVLCDVVRCAELVGQGDGTDGVSKNLSHTIQNTLQLFREGRINLSEYYFARSPSWSEECFAPVIATAVAEEGLDLPVCVAPPPHVFALRLL
jgi:endoribonuclease Dicer